MSKKLFVNGQFYTFEKEQPFAEALYMENGRIVAIGSKQELELQIGRVDVERVDLEGGYAYPGFVDNHMHLALFGRKLATLDFSEARSKEEMFYLLRKRMEQTPEGEWIVGLNWDENKLPGREIPTLQELDELAPHHPLFLTRTCYHTHLVNSCAYERAGVTRDRENPDGGSFGRDERGNLNGLVYEQASYVFKAVQSEPTYEELKDNVRQGMRHALSAGLTAVHIDELRELKNLDTLIKIFRELREEGLALRSHHLIYHPHLEEVDELGITAGSGDDWIRFGACKIFSDGSIGGRTALLSEPYADAPHTKGLGIHTPEEFFAITEAARKRGLPIAVHAIGDGGAELTIEAMERFPVEEFVKNGYRDRLIHAQIMREELVERLKKLHVAVDIQPRFVASDFPWVMDRVGPNRLEYAYAWRQLLNAGLLCGAGSDCPIEPIDPRLGIHAAITRRKPEEKVHEGYLPQEKLTVHEAISLFTLGTTYATNEQNERGTLKVGKFGDLTVMDRNLLEVEPEEILKAETLCTVSNGEIGFSKL